MQSKDRSKQRVGPQSTKNGARYVPGKQAPGFTPQQIRAIKDSPKGKLPNFLKAYSYKGPDEIGRQVDIKSVGGRVGKVGGTVGYDKVSKRPFGSVNYKGKIKAKFGPTTGG